MEPLNREYKILDSNIQASIDRYEKATIEEPKKLLTEYNNFAPRIVDLTRGILFDLAKKAEVAGSFANEYLTQDFLQSKLSRSEGLDNISLSEFNLPVWDPVLLISGSDNIYMGIAKVELTQSRNIVTTAVAGVDGTIKEFISNGDDMITITANIISDIPDSYPKDVIIALKSVLDKKEPIKIYGEVVNRVLGLDEIVVTGYTITQPNEGMRNVQQVEIQCLSDNPDLYKIIMFG